MTKSQIDKLGERLKAGNLTEQDLRSLDEYRKSLNAAYEDVTNKIRNILHLTPTGRPAKSTQSIVAKLRREPNMRLSRIQDIAGCRIVVDGISDQEQVIESLRSIFEDISIKDRRKQSRHGYRAVHLIVKVNGQFFEVQIRTVLQQLWAEFSERLSDTVDARIKYGEGPSLPLRRLEDASAFVAEIEGYESDHFNMKLEAGIRPIDLPLPQEIRNKKNEIRKLLESMVNEQ